jgi:hypothetical protein
MPIDIHQAMARLSKTRPLFHSEADFQHALAWQLQTQHLAISLRLEYRSPHIPQRGYIDIWLTDGIERVAIELKYKTRALQATVNGEKFDLLNQSAQDLGRYDAIKDIQRLEHVVAGEPHSTGFLILLTNDNTYWTASSRIASVDAKFRLHHGRTLSGALEWAEHASKGTRKGREAVLNLTGNYQLNWLDYGVTQDGLYRQFRYVLVKVARSP